MKKSELVIGEEYACVRTPGVARSRHNYGAQPFKARLVSLDFAEDRYEPASGYYSSSPWRERRQVGIAVDTGEKVVAEAQIGVTKRDAKGKVERVMAKDGYGGLQQKLRTKKFSYDYVILENGGCFLSTWAEYEAEEKAEAECVAARERSKNAEAKRLSENDPAVRVRVEGIVARLKELAGEGAQVWYTRYDWQRDGDINPEDVSVARPCKPGEYNDRNLVGEPELHRFVKGEYRYGNGPKGERCMVACVFEIHDDEFAELLGLEGGD